VIFFSVSENKKLKGAKRKKEILFGGKAPPMAGAILMFLPRTIHFVQVRGRRLGASR
jgi:hypothetical protein